MTFYDDRCLLTICTILSFLLQSSKAFRGLPSIGHSISRSDAMHLPRIVRLHSFYNIRDSTNNSTASAADAVESALDPTLTPSTPLENYLKFITDSLAPTISSNIKSSKRYSDYVGRKTGKEVKKLVSRTSSLISLANEIPSAINKTDSYLSYFKAGLNPFDSEKLLSNFDAVYAKDKARIIRRKRDISKVSTQSVYRSVRTMVDKAKYDYARKKNREKLLGLQSASNHVSILLPVDDDALSSIERKSDDVSSSLSPSSIDNEEILFDYQSEIFNYATNGKLRQIYNELIWLSDLLSDHNSKVTGTSSSNDIYLIVFCDEVYDAIDIIDEWIIAERSFNVSTSDNTTRLDHDTVLRYDLSSFNGSLINEKSLSDVSYVLETILKSVNFDMKLYDVSLKTDVIQVENDMASILRNVVTSCNSIDRIDEKKDSYIEFYRCINGYEYRDNINKLKSNGIGIPATTIDTTVVDKEEKLSTTIKKTIEETADLVVFIAVPMIKLVTSATAVLSMQAYDRAMKAFYLDDYLLKQELKDIVYERNNNNDSNNDNSHDGTDGCNTSENWTELLTKKRL